MQPDEFAQHYLNRLQVYISEVTGGTRIVGLREKQAVNRFIDLRSKYLYKEGEVITRLRFFSLINLPLKRKGLRQIVLADWQVFLLCNIYGLYKDDTDRLINEIIVSSAGKQGKTSLICAIALCNIVCEDPYNNNIVITSVTNKQASAILKYCKDIIVNSPVLAGLFKILHSNIICKANGASVSIFSNDATKIQGLNLRNSFHDEFFIYETQNEVDTKEIALEKMSLQSNPFQFIIGTFGNVLVNHLTYHNYYKPWCDILDGIAESDSTFIYFFQLDDKKKIQPADYVKANPSLGILQTEAELTAKHEKAKQFPAQLNLFHREKLNFWDESTKSDLFITPELVETCFTDNDIPLQSKVIISYDGSRNKDLAGINVLWYTGGTFYNKTINIIPNAPENYVKNGLDLRRWFVQDLAKFKESNYNTRGQYIIPSNEPILDEGLIFDILTDLQAKYKVVKFVYDPANNLPLINRLQKKRIEVEPVGQGIMIQSMPIKLMERLIYTGKFKILRSNLVKWESTNLLCFSDINNNIKFDKRQNKGAGSIDAWSAILNTLVAWCEMNQQIVLTSYSSVVKPDN